MAKNQNKPIRIIKTTRKGKLHNYIITINGYTHKVAPTQREAFLKAKVLQKSKKFSCDNKIKLNKTPIRV